MQEQAEKEAVDCDPYETLGQIAERYGPLTALLCARAEGLPWNLPTTSLERAMVDFAALRDAVIALKSNGQAAPEIAAIST